MSEQQFEVFQECEYLEEWSSCPYCIKYNGETVFETLPLGIAKEVCKKLNEQQATIEMYRRRVDKREEQISIIKKHRKGLLLIRIIKHRRILIICRCFLFDKLEFE